MLKTALYGSISKPHASPWVLIALGFETKLFNVSTGVEITNNTGMFDSCL